MPQPEEVVIMGQTFSVTSEDGKEHVREVAAYIDRTMRIHAREGGVLLHRRRARRIEYC
jgi:cell division protein ZapA (FtsZ GTPase activity inhibitor)